MKKLKIFQKGSKFAFIFSYFQLFPPRSFKQALSLSLAGHLLFFGAIIFTQSKDVHLISTKRGWLPAWLSRVTSPSSPSASLLPTLPPAWQGSLFDSIDKFNLPEEEKAALLEKLLRSWIGSYQDKFPPGEMPFSPQELLKFWEQQPFFNFDSGDVVIPSLPPVPPDELKLFFLPKEKKEQLQEFKFRGQVDRDDVVIFRHKVLIKTPEGKVAIPEEYFFRQCPYEQLLACGAGLFYITEGFPLLDDSAKRKAEKEASLSPEAVLSGDRFLGVEDFKVILVHPPSSEKPPPLQLEPEDVSNRPPLKIYQPDPQQVQRLLDSLMTFSEGLQFKFFKEKYLDKYHPDQGDLPRLTREFIKLNLSNVIIAYNPIAGAFGFIEQLFYSKHLDYAFLEYWRRHPYTRTGWEALFYIASHLNFEKRGLAYLYHAYDEAKIALRRWGVETDVHQKKAKAYVIKEVFEELLSILKQKGYKSLDDVLTWYAQKEAEIYKFMASHGGEIKNRALFALGLLHWEEGEEEKALSVWQDIDSAYADETFQDIREIMSYSLPLTKRIKMIRGVLNWEQNRSSEQQLDRLIKFHRWQVRTKTLPVV